MAAAQGDAAPKKRLRVYQQWEGNEVRPVRAAAGAGRALMDRVTRGRPLHSRRLPQHLPLAICCVWGLAAELPACSWLRTGPA
jgi:hypothetical protein